MIPLPVGYQLRRQFFAAMAHEPLVDQMRGLRLQLPDHVFVFAGMLFWDNGFRCARELEGAALCDMVGLESVPPQLLAQLRLILAAAAREERGEAAQTSACARLEIVPRQVVQGSEADPGMRRRPGHVRLR